MADGLSPNHLGRDFETRTTDGGPGLHSHPKLEEGQGSSTGQMLQLAGILLIALNLRPALATVGPLVAEIRADTGLSNTALGLLTALPVLAFGGVSAFSLSVTRLLGFGGALAAALMLLIGGAAVRAAPSVGLLYAGTLALGVGIALANVLLPALVKRDFAHRSGLLTSLYSSVLGLGAALGAGIAVPLALLIGWRNTLAIWALPAVLAFLVWLPQVRAREASNAPAHGTAMTLRSMLRSGLAWELALFMGLQSLTFYVIIAWLPDLLQSRGMSPEGAGLMLAASQIAGVAGSAAVPIIAGRLSDQRSIVLSLAALEGIALGGLLFDAGFLLTLTFVSILGLVLGGTLGLALLLLVLRSPNAATTTQLSGMVQSVGYLIAAAGPVVFGWLFEQTGGWTVPLGFLLLVLLGKFASGVGAARPGRYVGHLR